MEAVHYAKQGELTGKCKQEFKVAVVFGGDTTESWVRN
jgi:hypothetical protein